MPSLTTEGIILKRVNFGEADKILTVLTDKYGKIAITARGIRKITSRRAGNVEVLNTVKLRLFKGRGYTLTEAESLETYPRIKSNLTLSATGFHVAELVDRLVAEEQINARLYDLTISALKVIERNPRQIVVRAFEVKLLSILGFWGAGGFGDIGADISTILKKLQYLSFTEIERLVVSAEQALALERIMRYHIERILESKLKSVEVLKKLKA